MSGLLASPPGQKIKDILLAESEQDLPEALALLAFEFECEARTYREAFLAAVDDLHEEHLDRQRRQALLDQRRRSFRKDGLAA